MTIKPIGPGQNPRRMIDRVELSHHLEITQQEAYALISDGVIEGYQYGSTVLVDPRCITATLRKRVSMWRESRNEALR